MHAALVEDPARHEDQKDGHEPAEHDHPVALDPFDGFEKPDVKQHAEDRSDRRAEAADQPVGEAVNAEHDIEILGINGRLDMGVEGAADRCNGAGKPRHQDLVPRHVDALGLGQQPVCANGPDDRAEAAALHQEEEKQYDAQRAVDHPQEVDRLVFVVEAPADVAEPFRAVRADRFAVDLDLPGGRDQNQANRFGKREGCDGEIEAAQAQRQAADEGRRKPRNDHGKRQGEPEAHAEHGRHDPGGIGADAVEGLLAEGNLAAEQKQIGGKRDERKTADIVQHRDDMVVHDPAPRPAPSPAAPRPA